LVRCPEGQPKGCFYQKHWTTALPPGIDTVDIEEESGKVQPYVVVRDVSGLVSLVQHGVLEVHLWGARADNVDAPDRIVFDLDPSPEVGWRGVVQAARELRERLDALGLESWIKTTGGKGLHLVIPLGRRSTWADVSAFARGIANQMVSDSPTKYLAKASKAARKGLIFVDWLRNIRGATWVAAWSTRARTEASISVPIDWKELDKLKSGDQFTLGSVLQLGRRRRRDPWADLLRSRQQLSKSILAKID
jgi:bifunctional non-homologous end joining protein LigD